MQIKKGFKNILSLGLIFSFTFVFSFGVINNNAVLAENTKKEDVLNLKGIGSINLNLIYEKLEKRKNEYNKKEFETTNEYKNRIKNLEKLPLIGNLKMSEVSIFNGPLITKDNKSFKNYNLDMKYNPDKEIMTFFLYFNTYKPNDPDSSDFLDDAKYFISTEKYTKLSSYIGENAFGVKRKISRVIHDYTNLVIQNWYDFINMESENNNIVKINVPMKLQKAKELKSKYQNKLNYFINGKIREPYIGKDSDFILSTIDAPTDILIYNYFVSIMAFNISIYNPVTGEIFAVIKEVPYNNNSFEVKYNLFKINSEIGKFLISGFKISNEDTINEEEEIKTKFKAFIKLFNLEKKELNNFSLKVIFKDSFNDKNEDNFLLFDIEKLESQKEIKIEKILEENKFNLSDFSAIYKVKFIKK